MRAVIPARPAASTWLRIRASSGDTITVGPAPRPRRRAGRDEVHGRLAPAGALDDERPPPAGDQCLDRPPTGPRAGRRRRARRAPAASFGVIPHDRRPYRGGVRLETAFEVGRELSGVATTWMGTHLARRTTRWTALRRVPAARCRDDGRWRCLARGPQPGSAGSPVMARVAGFVVPSTGDCSTGTGAVGTSSLVYEWETDGKGNAVGTFWAWS